MVLDPSALIAYLNGEPEAERLEEAMLRADSLRLSAASLVEAGIVADRMRSGDGGVRLDRLLARLRVEIVPLTEDQAHTAREAYHRFGKGRHPAGLNFGDCFAYALARELAEPLLFTGGDFSQTDVAVAPY